MSLFDLLFIAAFLATVITLAVAAVAALLSHRARAFSLLRGWAIFAAVYFATLIIVSLASPRRVLNIGEERCWDDWCIVVSGFQRTPSVAPADGTISYAVTFRLSSHARRISQRENGLTPYLVDNLDRQYDSVPALSTGPFNVLLGPGGSAVATRVFQVPGDARGLGLVFSHAGPGLFIIGDDGSLFHKRTIVPLD